MKHDKMLEAVEGMLCTYERNCLCDYLNFRLIQASEQYRQFLAREGVEPLTKISGPQKHWREFREYLLSCKGEVRFDPRFQEASMYGRAFHSSLIASWSAHSRRVFQLSPRMQYAFSVLEPGDMKCADIFWPFPAFAVQLANPISDEGYHSTTIIVSSAFESHWMFPEDFRIQLAALGVEKLKQKKLVYPINDKYRSVSRLDDEKVRKLVRYASRGEVPKVLPFLEQNELLVTETLGDEHVNEFLVDLESDTTIVELEQSIRLLSAVALRIVNNLCLFLSNRLPEEKLRGEQWKPNPSAPKPTLRCVTDGANICVIDSFSVLMGMAGNTQKEESVDSRKKNSNQKRTVTPHWRRAYKRRRPGMGGVPDAPRDVDVRHVIVNKHLLGENALPVGQCTLVK